MKLPSSSPLDLGSTDAAAGCLSGVLRRLLCWSLRRSTPRDGEEVDAAIAQEWKAAEQHKSSAPGIVARLMGLESMPVFPCALPDSIGRSRSTNSLQSWPGFLAHKRASSDPQSRLVQSFREVPTYLRQENEDFLLLSFTPDAGDESFLSNDTKSRMGIRELKAEGASKAKERRTVEKRSGRRNCCRENAPGRNHSNAKDSIPPNKDAHRNPRRGVKAGGSAKHREMPERSISRRKKLAYANRRVELECSSQNSSPVSVLDHPLDTDGEYLLSPNSPVSEEDRRPGQRRSRRKLSSDLVDRKDASLTIHLTRISSDGGRRSLDQQKNNSRKPEQAGYDFSAMWVLICRLNAEDVKTSNWVSREIHNSEVVGELAAIIGMEILDFLLREAVAEFSVCTITI